MEKSFGYYNLGGTIRACKPLDTLKRAKKLYTKLGITRVANVTGLDTIGIPVYVCIRPNAKHLSVSQGKGVTNDLAEASAVMETVEGYHIENAPPAALTGSYNKLRKSYNLIDPRKMCECFFCGINWQDREMQWAKGRELISDKEIYLPHVLTTLDLSSKGAEKVMVRISSNGLASGNSLEEAICHALYEVIERDSMITWSQDFAKDRDNDALDLTTINVPIIQKILQQFAKAKVFVKVWEVTSKVGLPTFYAAIQDSNLLRPLGKFYGVGAHISSNVALLRALTEAAQSRLTFISGSRDDVSPSRYLSRIAQDYSKIEKEFANGERDFAMCFGVDYEDGFASNIQQVLKMVQKAGFNQVIVFDHTRDDFKIPVVQVFVPGASYATRQ